MKLKWSQLAEVSPMGFYSNSNAWTKTDSLLSFKRLLTSTWRHLGWKRRVTGTIDNSRMYKPVLVY